MSKQEETPELATVTFPQAFIFWGYSSIFNRQNPVVALKVEVYARDSHSIRRTALFSHLVTDPCLHMELAPHLLSKMLTCLCSIPTASRKAQSLRKTWHSIYVPAVPDSYHSTSPCRQIFHSLSIHKDKFSKVTGDNWAPSLPFSSLSSPYKSGLIEERAQIIRATWFVVAVETINYINGSLTTGTEWCRPCLHSLLH